jgi:hypothetical protein
MAERTKAKVVSISTWKESRKLEETMTAGLFYQTLLGNLAKEKRDEGISYFKIVYSITAENIPEEDPFYEFEEDEFLTAIRDASIRDLIPLNGHVIEKYEFYDLNTDDVHVIYRIPYEPLGSRPLTP